MEPIEIKRRILLEYETLKDFAEEIGTSESQLSRWIKKPSERFRIILTKYGILEDNSSMVADERQIENTAETIKDLKNLVYEKNALIKELNNVVVQKDKIIKQYEKLIDAAIKERA